MTKQAHTEKSLSSQIHVEVHKREACGIELEVHAPEEMIQEARKKAIKRAGKEVSLPGFRKGKAPEEVILKKFPDQVEKALHKELADLSFIAAQRSVQIPVLNQNSQISFHLKKIDETGADVSFSFETEPEVPDVNPDEVSLKEVSRPEVGEKQIEEAIRQMRFFYAQWTPVTDRAIQDGDYIMIDLDTVDGEKTERVFHQIRFEVSQEKMADWMKELVQGAKAGDILDGESRPDQAASEEEKKEFQPKKVRIHILKVEEATLPEVDDEFAKKVGAPDVFKMRESITRLLNDQADQTVESDQREQVNQYLVDRYSFDLPKSLLQTEKEHRLRQLQTDTAFKRKWDIMSQEERKEVEEKILKEAKEALRLFYLSRSIVEKAKIPVTHQEVQAEALSSYRGHRGEKQMDLPKEVYALAFSKVLLKKAQNYLLKKT